VGGVRRIIMIVVGWALTWTAAAVGIWMYGRLLGTDVADTEVLDAQVAPPAVAPAPSPEAIGAKVEPAAEPAAKPPIEVELSCTDPRFRAIRRALQQYCRAPLRDFEGTFCRDMTKQFRSCRTASPLRLTHPGGCHPQGLYGVRRTRTICHDYLALLPDVDDTANYIGLTRSAGRWKVERLEQDDLERP
jgi:hypothetical protein